MELLEACCFIGYYRVLALSAILSHSYSHFSFFTMEQVTIEMNETFFSS